MRARIEVDDRQLVIDLARPISLARELDFAGVSPRHFGAPAPTSRPFAVPGFSGSVTQGAGCNCNIITLIPHCNATHTECVGHLTSEAMDAHRVIPAGLLPAVLVSVQPVKVAAVAQTTDPAPQSGDRLITQSALEAAWSLSSSANVALKARALVLRTLPNERNKTLSNHTAEDAAPYLTREAAQWLVDRGIEHLVVDLPSIDRTHDQGRLTAHRLFFGLPRDSHALAAAQRPRSTITELAFVPDEAADGAYLLQLQAPAIGGDAVPSRPVLYRLEQS